MKRGLTEIVVMGLTIAVVVGVPAYFIREGVGWIESRFGTNSAAMAIGGAIILAAFIGGAAFMQRGIRRAQSDLLDGLDQLGEVMRSFAGSHKANAQAALIEQRAAADHERRFQAMVDQRVKMLTAGTVPAAPAAPASWAIGLQDETGPASAPAAGRGVRYVE